MKSGLYRSAIVSLICAGCTVGPVYEAPEIDVPCVWHTEIPEGLDSTSNQEVVWWECLQDEVLNQLIACAASQNLDLQIAAVRILQAREELKGKKADLYPHIDGSANYGHVQYSKNALVNGVLSNTLPIDSKAHRRNINFFELGFDVDWELDFFGLTAHEVAAMKAHEESVQENLCAVWVTLSAEIARNYIELRSLQHRFKIFQKRIDQQEESMRLTKELLGRGVVNESDYNIEEAEWNALKGELPPLEAQMARAIHRLSILLGCSPGELFESLASAAPLPTQPVEGSIGLPSELLRRRPDIRKAERELAAATERVGSAVAALFPRFSLRGFIGDVTTHTGSLFTPSSVTWYAGPQVLVPIFNSRLLLQAVDYNKLVTQEALYNYQKTVLEALEEVENAIALYHSEGQRLVHLSEAYQSNRKALEFATALYQKGVVNSFAVTKAKKALLASEEALLQTRTELLLGYVSLYKALGGSWGY